MGDGRLKYFGARESMISFYMKHLNVSRVGYFLHWGIHPLWIPRDDGICVQNVYPDCSGDHKRGNSSINLPYVQNAKARSNDKPRVGNDISNIYDRD